MMSEMTLINAVSVECPDRYADWSGGIESESTRCLEASVKLLLLGPLLSRLRMGCGSIEDPCRNADDRSISSITFDKCLV